MNKGKRSLALDLSTEGGQDILRRLIATADVFVTNGTTERNEKLGLGYDQLRAHKPDLVYAENTGFGATGPYRNIPTHGQMMDALAGGRPMMVGNDGLTYPKQPVRPWSSMTVGSEGVAAGAVYTAFHVAAALAHRERTGAGCLIDVSAAAAVVATAWTAANAQLNRPALVEAMEREDQWQGIARYQWYLTKDEQIVLFCPEEKGFWERFCDLVGREDLKDQIRGVELRREIQAIISTRTRRRVDAVRHRASPAVRAELRDGRRDP